MKKILFMIIFMFVFLAACEEEKTLKGTALSAEKIGEIQKAEVERIAEAEAEAKKLKQQKLNEKCLAELAERYEEILEKASWEAILDMSWKNEMEYEKARRECSHEGVSDMEKELEEKIFPGKCKELSRFDSELHSKNSEAEEIQEEKNDLEEEIENKKEEIDEIKNSIKNETDSERGNSLEEEKTEAEEELADLETDWERARSEIAELAKEEREAENRKEKAYSFCSKF